MKNYNEFGSDFDSYCKFVEGERGKEIEYLNQLDILPLLKKGIEIEELMATLHDSFNEEYDGEDMFDALDEYDVMDYIEHRFGAQFEWISYTRCYLADDPQKGTRYDTNTVSDIPEVE